jgi:hypothetical protein
MEKWKKISIVGFPVVTIFGFYTMYNHYAHHKEPAAVIPYPHNKIRSKPFPWDSKDCDLWDFKCQKAAQAAAKAASE